MASVDYLDEIDSALRNDIRRLGNQLGDALVRQTVRSGVHAHCRSGAAAIVW